MSIAGCSKINSFAHQSKPNIIVLLADQLGLNHCGYANNDKAITPNIDKLASQSMNFSNAVANTPVCSAFRASFMTGKYTTSHGMVINELRLNPNQKCLGHCLSDAGYQTSYIGKWHMYANELGNHFDPKNSFVPRGQHRLGFDGYWAAFNFHHIYYNAYYHTESPEKIFYSPDVYEPDAQTDLAINWLKQNSAKPFSMVLSYGTPHDPWSDDNVPKEYREKFKDSSLPNPPNYKDQNDKPYADGWASLSPQQRKELQNWRRNYYAMTTNLDKNIGRILKHLDTNGLAENTIVIFSSDHGEMFGAQGRRAKNIFYNEACQIPFLVRWPNKIKPGTSNANISTVDMMPTILGLANINAPDSAEGMNLAHLATGNDGPEPECAFMQGTGATANWDTGHEWRAIRNQKFTYAKYLVDGKELLFDNVNDPYQINNLAQNPTYKQVLNKFQKLMKQKMASLDDTFEKSTYYKENWVDKDRKILKGAKK
ncbi:MAG: sulfatase [Phycisphaerae bacterium]|nr:sulfatase [Phycisphaerae bacterium]